MFPQSIPKAKAQAFTLVEIALALGIVAFAVIISFGLVSTSTQSFGDTRRDTVYANILQYIAANANLTPYADLTTQLNGKQWGFDAEGLRNDPDANPGGVASASPAPTIYYAYIQVKDAPLLPGKIGDGTSTQSGNVKSVDVILTDAGTKHDSGNAAHSTPYHILIGNLGQ